MSQNHQMRYALIGIGFLLTLHICTTVLIACSWDYRIWIPRSKSADPVYRFVRDGKAGYIDRSGKILIEPTFDAYGNYGGEFHDGLMVINISEGRYADITGKVVIDKGYYRGWDFSEGLAVAMDKDEGKWGYIDRSGEFAISQRLAWSLNDYLYSFSEGLAKIKVANRHGYIDRSGEFVIAPIFLEGAEFHDGMARVVVEGPCLYSGDSPCPDVDLIPDGHLMLGGQNSTVSMCKFTFINKSGAIITTERYERAGYFSEGLAPVKSGKKWGFIDKQGQMVIKPRFESAEPFSDGRARVQQNNLYGYIDYSGAFVITPQFQYAENFSEELAVVSRWLKPEIRKMEFFYINKEGNQAIRENFAIASPFFKGLAHVQLKSNKQNDEKESSDAKSVFAYIDSSGKRVFTYLN
jgi:hypothetical protein